MSIQWLLPSIDPEFRQACIEGMSPGVRQRTLLLDNSVHNRGCAVSWNIGRDRALSIGADWLIILSESMRFGDAGGEDFEAELDADEGSAMILGACDSTCTEVVNTGQGFCRRGYGWHMAAIARKTLELVGRWDEIFWPIYFEDTDYQRRMNIAKCDQGKMVTGIDAHLAACEHTVAAGFIKSGWPTTLPLYEAKWGGRPGDERFSHPYGNFDWDWTHVTTR